MLDTNIVSELARNPQGAVAKGPDAICVMHYYGGSVALWMRQEGSPKLLAQIEAILGSVQVLALDVPADAEYGGIRAELEAAGKPIGPNDLFIAAHAYVLGAVLVTTNSGEFTRVRDLRVENWLDLSSPQ